MIAAVQHVALRDTCSTAPAQNATGVHAAPANKAARTWAQQPISLLAAVWHDDCCSSSSVEHEGHMFDRRGGAAEADQNAAIRSHNEWETS